MKKTDIIINSLFYAVYMLVSCIVVMFADILAVKIVNLFIVTTPFSLCIIRAVIYTVGVNAILAIAAYKEGYRAAFSSPTATLISGTAATLMHFVFALLFNFEAFCAGGVRSITALIRFGSRIDSETFTGSLTRTDYILFFFINSIVYITVMVIFGMIGSCKRISDRQELTGSEE